jgi:hypothetical protein
VFQWSRNGFRDQQSWQSEFRSFKMFQSMKNWIGVGIVLAGGATSDSLQAQGPAIAAPISNWSYLDHSSTYTEGALRGQSAMISAAGQATYLNSLAAINYTEAVKRAIENSVAITQAYYDRREIREEYLKKYGPKPFVGEARRKAIEYYQPKRLSAQEFDSKLGKLHWPHVLRQEQFEAIISQIDEAFAKRTPETSGDGSSSHRKLAQLCNALSGILRENIANVSVDHYISSREFIRSVELEAKTPMSAEAVIINANATENPTNEAEPKGPANNTENDTTSKRIRSNRVRT